jgi:RimJ/RimL family protein N-acetyltransferase
MPILTGHDDAVAQWVAGNLGVTIAPPYVSLGVLGADSVLIGGAVFSGYSGANIDVTIYGPRAMTRAAMRASFGYVFGQLRCERLTARCKRSNASMRRLMDRLGFKHEGTQRRYWGPDRNDDAMVYGMTRDECRWLDAGS